MTEETKLFVIPQKDRSVIAALENNTIKVVSKIDVPFASKSVFLKNRLFVSLCFGGKVKSHRLKIFDEWGKQLARKPEYKFACINSRDNVVYLGGQYNRKKGEMFSVMDLENLNFNAHEVELPLQSIEGKSIDDILIRNNELILVDNIVFPKYLFKYDITIPSSPGHMATHELPDNGTYEHIRKGDIHENWIMLFSSTVGMCRGACQHISIIGNENNMSEQAVLTFCVEPPLRYLREDKMAPNEEKIWDTCIIKDQLLILKESGLYSIDLAEKMSKENISLLSGNDKKYTRLLKINEEQCVILNREAYELLYSRGT
ncbi:MAG: hypothetical protein FWB99_00040 [Treponema sp.]|nr:hypothetical protein [Treponema sp.]